MTLACSYLSLSKTIKLDCSITAVYIYIYIFVALNSALGILVAVIRRVVILYKHPISYFNMPLHLWSSSESFG